MKKCSFVLMMFVLCGSVLPSAAEIVVENIIEVPVVEAVAPDKDGTTEAADEDADSASKVDSIAFVNVIS